MVAVLPIEPGRGREDSTIRHGRSSRAPPPLWRLACLRSLWRHAVPARSTRHGLRASAPLCCPGLSPSTRPTPSRQAPNPGTTPADGKRFEEEKKNHSPRRHQINSLNGLTHRRSRPRVATRSDRPPAQLPSSRLPRTDPSGLPGFPLRVLVALVVSARPGLLDAAVPAAGS